MQYHFYRLQSDITPYATPTSGAVEASSYQEAIGLFCKQHQFALNEVDGDKFWCDNMPGRHTKAPRNNLRALTCVPLTVTAS